MKPMLASDAVISKLSFPVIAQPKIDGVRALNVGGRFTGRSLKGFKNRYVTARYSHPLLEGLDGELAAESHVHPALCRLTTSAVGTITGEPFLIWWLFDLIDPTTEGAGYRGRLDMLRVRYDSIRNADPDLYRNLRVVPWELVESPERLLELDDGWLAEGYEGSIVRAPGGLHKQGRSTTREGGLLRIKRFVDFEFRITGVTEGQSNLNEAKTNALGHTERSTHADNMVPNGMVGTLQGVVVSDVVYEGRVLFPAGAEVTVSAGCLTHDERRKYFLDPAQIIGRIGKAKFFPKGIKDKLRHPTFQSFRDPVDMG